MPHVSAVRATGWVLEEQLGSAAPGERVGMGEGRTGEESWKIVSE